MNYREILEDFVNNENTYYCYDWQGFDYETILPCIEQLLKNENNLQSKIDKAIEYINKLKNFKIKHVMLEEKELYASEKDFVKDLLDILKEEK